MAKTAFIDWEGRGYEPRHWDIDKDIALQLLGRPPRFYTAGYDLGLLVSDAPITPDTRINAWIRRGTLDATDPDEPLEPSLLGDSELWISMKELESTHPEWFE